MPTADREELGLFPDGVPAQPEGLFETDRVWVKDVPRHRLDVEGVQVPVDQDVQAGGRLLAHDPVVLVPVAGCDEAGWFPGGVPVQPAGDAVTDRVWAKVTPAHRADVAGVQELVSQAVQVWTAQALPA